MRTYGVTTHTTPRSDGGEGARQARGRPPPERRGDAADVRQQQEHAVLRAAAPERHVQAVGAAARQALRGAGARLQGAHAGAHLRRAAAEPRRAAPARRLARPPGAAAPRPLPAGRAHPQVMLLSL